MKNFSFLVFFAVGMHLAGWCQFTLKPIALSGVSAIRHIQLPEPAFRPVQVSLPGAARLTDGCTNTSCASILPLTSLILEGNRVNSYQVALRWKTKNETASKGFETERSLGDAAHFSVAGTTASLPGNAAEKSYSQADANSYAGISFYRVKQTDLDGQFTYSNTIEISGYKGTEKVWLSPNPAGTRTTLSCFSVSEGTATVKLLTTHGQQLYVSKWNLYAGANTRELMVGQYAAGVYVVQLYWPDGRCTSRKLEIE